ncbi:helix-turn-helix transcriptional regulator [Halomarina pelagica]|uniref:helix-turn-helix transcriptional regulator n=1 Tax=Halomarina pelagica TaxID=2961599 RepID=UPI0020C45067|nr:hypothetical protein [Halomarina sp. BND7]
MDGTEERTGPWGGVDVGERTVGAGARGPADGPTDPTDPGEAIDTVARRFDFLTTLTDGPKHRPVLQHELDVSRSTAYKGIRELEELRLVERTDQGYRLSLLGKLLLAQYDQFRANVETVCAKGPLLAELSADCGVTVEVLRDAEVVYAEKHAPHHPFHVLETMVEEATALRGMTPVVRHGYVELFYEQFVADTLETDLILGRPVVQWLAEYQCEPFVAALETGNLVVREIEEWVPFGLILSDEPTTQVGAFVHDDRGGLRGAVVNDTDDALAWGERIWERYRDRSTVVTTEVIEADDR